MKSKAEHLKWRAGEVAVSEPSLHTDAVCFTDALHNQFQSITAPARVISLSHRALFSQ